MKLNVLKFVFVFAFMFNSFLTASDFKQLINKSLASIETNLKECGFLLVDVSFNPQFNRRNIKTLINTPQGQTVGFYREMIGYYEITSEPLHRSFKINEDNHRVSFSTPFDGIVARANTYRFGPNELRLNAYCRFAANPLASYEQLELCVAEYFVSTISRFFCPSSL